MVIERATVAFHLDRILSSAEFAKSARMARFLRFVVESSQNPSGESLNERTVGVAVFDRPPDWDPKLDTIVRSEARRLRTKLDRYYADEGATDQVRIAIPKGGYAPTLEQVEPQRPPEPTPHPVARRGSKAPWAVLAACGLVALAWFSGRQNAPSKPAPEPFEIFPFATEFGPEINPAISPDGKRIAYVWDGNGSNYDIYIKPAGFQRSAEAPRVRFTSGPEAEINPAWSPDGREIAFFRVGQREASVVVKAVTGSAERVVASVERRGGGWLGDYSPAADAGPSWTRDGTSVVVCDRELEGPGHGLYQIDVATGRRRRLTRTEREISDLFPRVSPDGQQLAFVRYFSHGVSDVFVTPISEDRPRRLTFDNRTVTGLAWTPDSSGLIFASWRAGAARLWRVPARGGDPLGILSDSSSAADIAVSPSGDWLAYASISENWNIWRARILNTPQGRTLSAPERFLSSSGRNHGPRFSPDGKTLAFISDRSGAWEIWFCDPDGSNFRRMTHFNGPFLGSITWTSDSKKIAFDARPNGNSNIFVLDAAGGTPKALQPTHFEERVPCWSRDGKAIYFNSDRDGHAAVWRMTVADGSMLKVAPASSFKSAVSWDGKSLYYNARGGFLWRADPDGANAKQLDGVMVSPSINWAVGPESLFYTRQERPAEADFYEFADGKPRLLARTAGQLVLSTTNLVVSPDGQWLLYAQQDHFTSDIHLRRGSLN